ALRAARQPPLRSPPKSFVPDALCCSFRLAFSCDCRSYNVRMTRLVTGGRARIQSLAERAPPAVVRALPVAVLLVVTWRLSWSEHGSIAAGDWLVYAVLVALVLATVILSGAAVLPTRAALVSLGFLLAFSAWEALSLT